MTTATATPWYKGYRLPQEIIAHAVWLYQRFNLSFRDVEELLAARGVVVTYETVRPWCKKFGQQFAKQFRCRRAQPGDKWYADEVFLKINGKILYLWRAVDKLVTSWISSCRVADTNAQLSNSAPLRGTRAAEGLCVRPARADQ